MITDIDSFRRYFDAVHRRAFRDAGALPPEAERWSPPPSTSLRTGAGEADARRGENAWSIADIVRHMAGARLYFANAYRGDGWIMDWTVPTTESQSSWLPALEASAEEFHQRLDGTPAEWLTRKVTMIDTDASLSGWRILMMMLEHDIHHRSQIDTYAGLEGWDVPDIHGRSAEDVGLQQRRQWESYIRAPEMACRKAACQQTGYSNWNESSMALKRSSPAGQVSGL